MTRHYLDHAANTPMVPEAVEAMTRELGRPGNASALHASGRRARRVVEEARESIAGHLGAKPAEVIFTSGGTEADNLAVKGAFWAQRDAVRRDVVISAVEHHAVLDSAGWLADHEGAVLRTVGVDATGRVDPDALAAAVTEHTAVASLIWANNEVGTVQPVAELAALAARAGAVSHSDAVQAVGHVEVDFELSGLDLMTFTAHKLGGPYGVGALLAKRETALTSVLHGGGQERDVRSGTVDVAAVAGFAVAVEVAMSRRSSEAVRLAGLRDALVGRVRALVPDVVAYGSPAAGPDGSRLPGVASLGFPGCSADALLMLLDAAGIDCSSGAACSAGVSQPSHVLQAMGADDEQARSVLRFSLGHSSTAADVDAVLGALPDAVARARAAAAYA